jgi:hypothetical protein
VQRNLMVMEMDTLEVFSCLIHRTLYFRRTYTTDSSGFESG